jgi:type II secretion system protein N
MGDGVRKRRWGRRVVIALVVLVVPLVVGYFVATSEPFFKGVILPKASKSLNAKITVAEAAIKPFSQVILRGVKVHTTGAEPLAIVQEARVRHSLVDILRGNIKVQEITALSPVIHIVMNPDGTSNLDPLRKPQKAEKPAGKPSERKPKEPTRLDIGQIKIENGTLRKTQLVEGGSPQVTEISNLNFTVANVQNGEAGSLDLSGQLGGQLEGALQGKVNFALTEKLKPQSLSGNAAVVINKTSLRLPVMNLNLEYGAAIDGATAALMLQTFSLTVTQNQRPLIAASLAQPMRIGLAQTTSALPDSTLNTKITGFSFKDWAALLGDDVPEGNLNANLELQSRESGKLLALKGDAEVSGLMLNDPEKRKLMKPLEAKVRIDSSFRDKVIELSQLAVALSPTQLAKNEASLKGRVDLSNTKAITGKLQLASEALDLNGYYDLIKGEEKKKTAAKRAPRSTGPASPEMTPVKKRKDLPFKDLALDTRIARVYLRELDLSNVVTDVKLDSTRIDLKPISLALNGAPVNGAVGVDLGVPGYGYVLELKMDSVPLAPIANSFAKEYSGRAKGDLNANLQIKGAGTTGKRLQKTLQGQITASCTNGQIQLVTERMRDLIDPIAMLFGLPELRTAPLTAFDGDIGLGEGKIHVKSLNLISDAFSAHTKGVIPIANVLTNSAIPRLPVTFALSRSLAERANLVPANTPGDTKYVPLPQFLFLTGTLGKPKTARNDAAIAGIVARRVLPSDVGKVLDTILGGPKATNAPSTNQPRNLLDSLLKKQPK